LKASKNGTARKTLKSVYIMAGGKMQRPEDYFEGKGGETQEIRKGKKTSSLVGDEFVAPPFNLDHLAKLLERSTPHYRSVKAKAEDAVGRGWILIKTDENASESDGEKLRKFFKRPNPRQTLTDILKCNLIDFETLGNAGLEVVRESQDGDPTELNSIQGRTLRIRKDFKVIAQTLNAEKTFFKIFGEDITIDKDTGKESEDIGFIQQGNEIFFMVKYHPKSDYYGIPDIIPALGALSLDISGRDFNLDFFDNNAIPATAVIIEGADVDDKMRTHIEDFFANELRGVGNQHRTIVIPVPHENVKVKIEPLSVAIKDGHFKSLRLESRDEQLSANGVPPIRAFHFQTGNLGRDATRELNKIYKDSTVKPPPNPQWGIAL